jgi:hypothetical protein
MNRRSVRRGGTAALQSLCLIGWTAGSGWAATESLQLDPPAVSEADSGSYHQGEPAAQHGETPQTYFERWLQDQQLQLAATLLGTAQDEPRSGPGAGRGPRPDGRNRPRERPRPDREPPGEPPPPPPPASTSTPTPTPTDGRGRSPRRSTPTRISRARSGRILESQSACGTPCAWVWLGTRSRNPRATSDARINAWTDARSDAWSEFICASTRCPRTPTSAARVWWGSAESPCHVDGVIPWPAHGAAGRMETDDRTDRRKRQAPRTPGV